MTNVRSYIRSVRKHWILLLTGVLLGLGGALVMVLSTAPSYASTVTFFINTPSDNIAASAQGDTFGQKRVNTYVQLIKTDRLADLVVADLGDGVSASDISAKIAAKGDANTVLLTATITDASPERSLQIARSVSTAFVSLVATLETAQDGGIPAVGLEVVDGPTSSTVPVSPDVPLTLGIGLMLGLLLGLAGAILRDALDTTVRSSEELHAETGLHTLGFIPFDGEAGDEPLVTELNRQSIRAESYRQLRTNLQFVNAATPVKAVMVTSSVSNEGKSSTAVNLATAFADAGLKVLLIEGDLRRPKVAEYLGLEGSVGLTNVLAGQVDVSEVLQRWGRSPLTVLPSGSIPPNPSELLGSRGMIDLVQGFRRDFDIVVIDSPPLLPVTDAAIISSYVDGALVVTRHGSTTKKQVQQSLQALSAVNATVLGFVLNRVPLKGADAYGYEYGYEDGATARPRLEMNSDPGTPAPDTADVVGPRHERTPHASAGLSS